MGASLQQLNRILNYITAVEADNSYPSSTRQIARDILFSLGSAKVILDNHIADIDNGGLPDADRDAAMAFLGDVIRHGLTGGLNDS